jgi:hypothetical protein
VQFFHLLPFGPKSAFPLATKNIRIKVHIISTVVHVLYGCETWSFTLREVHRLGVFENEILRKICGHCVMTSLMTCMPYKIFG